MSMATARTFVPVFNTQQTPFKLPLVRKEDGRIMAMETTAFPGTLFKLKNQHGDIWEVETTEYPSTDPIYVDARLLTTDPEPKERIKAMPPKETILNMLENLVGTRYFWGGNCPKGIVELLALYDKNIEKADLDDASCTGVDCSGLLYFVTNGCTPRNTSQLINFGINVDITNLSVQEICEISKPLDLIVWRGHVMITLPGKRIIESRLGHGVVITPFVERLQEVQRQLQAENKPYYVRRWSL